MASDLKSDLDLTAFQSRPTVHLMGNPAVPTYPAPHARSACSFYTVRHRRNIAKHKRLLSVSRKVAKLRVLFRKYSSYFNTVQGMWEINKSC